MMLHKPLCKIIIIQINSIQLNKIVPLSGRASQKKKKPQLVVGHIIVTTLIVLMRFE